MKILEILQREEPERYCDEANEETCGFTINESGQVSENCRNLWGLFYNTLTPEQKALYQNYQNVKEIYDTLESQATYQKGFKLAMRIMIESQT
jgi:hypothetical protein